MEYLISALIWLLVFGSAALLALIPAFFARVISKQKFSQGWSYFAGVVIVLCLLASISQKPMLFYSGDCTQSLSAEQEASVRSVSGGAYSLRAPLVSAVIIVEEVRDGYAAWTEYYFPVGNRKIELNDLDGFNCTKNLFPW